MINLNDITDAELDAICDQYYPDRTSYRNLAVVKKRFLEVSTKTLNCMTQLSSILSDDAKFESEITLDVSSEICSEIKVNAGRLNNCISEVLTIMDKSKMGSVYCQEGIRLHNDIPFSYDKTLADGVRVVQNEGITTISLPQLPPNKKLLSRFSYDLSDGKSYEIDTYYAAIAQILQNMAYKRYYEKVVVFFEFVYCEKDRSLTDHDNLATKSLLDLVTAFFLTDDSPDKCAHFYDYKMGEESGTIISIIPELFFPLYLLSRKETAEKK